MQIKYVVIELHSRLKNSPHQNASMNDQELRLISNSYVLGWFLYISQLYLSTLLQSRDRNADRFRWVADQLLLPFLPFVWIYLSLKDELLISSLQWSFRIHVKMHVINFVIRLCVDSQVNKPFTTFETKWIEFFSFKMVRKPW